MIKRTPWAPWEHRKIVEALQNPHYKGKTPAFIARRLGVVLPARTKNAITSRVYAVKDSLERANTKPQAPASSSTTKQAKLDLRTRVEGTKIVVQKANTTIIVRADGAIVIK